MVCLLLLPNTAKTDCNWWEQAPPPVVHGKVMPAHWWEEIKRSSERFQVNPFLAAAVAWIEGNGWDGDRIGHSPYWGPMGINECCPVPYEVLTDPLSNIRVGVAALRGDSPKAVLKRYNARWFKGHYIRDVLALTRQLEREARMKIGLAARSKGRGAPQREG